VEEDADGGGRNDIEWSAWHPDGGADVGDEKKVRKLIGTIVDVKASKEVLETLDKHFDWMVRRSQQPAWLQAKNGASCLLCKKLLCRKQCRLCECGKWVTQVSTTRSLAYVVLAHPRHYCF
jgi:hypothetical protein